MFVTAMNMAAMMSQNWTNCCHCCCYMNNKWLHIQQRKTHETLANSGSNRKKTEQNNNKNRKVYKVFMNQCTWISLLYFWLQGKYERTAFYELISKVIDLMWKLYIQWKHLQTMKPLCVVSTHFIPSVFAHLIIILFSLLNGGSLIAHLHATQFTNIKQHGSFDFVVVRHFLHAWTLLWFCFGTEAQWSRPKRKL